MQLAFPYGFDRTGRTAVAGDERYVRELVEQVLFTMPGERVMRPAFGSGIAQLVFEPNSDELATAVQFLVQGNLQQWLAELITVQSVDVSSDEATIEVRVEYVLRRDGERRVESFSRPI